MIAGREFARLIERRVSSQSSPDRRQPGDNPPDGQINSVYQNKSQVPGAKIFLFSRSRDAAIFLAIPSHQRGVAQRHQRGAGMRWTRMALLTRAFEADGEIVWS